jgi:hypothetical protein
MKDKDKPLFDREKWDNIFEKITKLCLRLKSAKGNYNMDDSEIRWCEDRVEYYTNDNRLLTVDEMKKANELWKLYQ